MKKKTLKKAVSIGLCAAMLTGMVTGCGGSDDSAKNTSSDSQSKSGGPYEEFLTVDVFDSQANFQGIQTGWFAKVVKDKFNMELNIIAPNVAGGGDTLFQTRSANGNLGDLIITNADAGRLKDLVTAGLVMDIDPYMSECKNLNKYTEAISAMEEVAGQEGVWAVPSEISNQEATEPCDATEPTNAPSLRWDVYESVGSPKMETLEDLLDTMELMQNSAGKSDSGKDVYAFSLFKDWDGDIMQNVGGLCALYGY